MKLTALGKQLFFPNRFDSELSALSNQFQYRPLVPLIEVHFQHIDAFNARTNEAIYGTVDLVQFLTMGINTVYLRVGSVLIVFGAMVSPGRIDFMNLDSTLEQSGWELREIRAAITYESQMRITQQKLTLHATSPWSRHIEFRRGRK